MATTTKPLITQLDADTKTKLNNMLTRIKGQLFTMPGAAYLSSIMFNQRFVWDLNHPTAYTTGKVIGWNPNFFVECTQSGRVFVLAHELWHTGYGHLTRIGNRCPDIWNIAADHVINLKLVEEGFDFEGVAVKSCCDPQFKNMTTEQVYDQLIANEMKPFEVPEFELGGMGGDIRPVTTEEDQEEIQQVIVQAQQAAIQANQAGSIPGEIRDFIDEFLHPKLNWRQLLRKYFTALSKDDYSWRRPSRRYDREYLPSLIGDNGLEHLIYYLDISGSITKGQIIRFFSEVRSIHKNLQPELLTIVTFDTSLHETFEFRKDQPFTEFEITGRGGTSLEAVKNHIKEHKPTAAVIFSDLYVHPMSEDPQVPLLWIVMDNEGADVPFGKMIHLGPEDLEA